MTLTRLRFRHLALAVFSYGLLAAGAFAAPGAAHDHDHGQASESLALDDGRKWTTDEPLRKAMTRIRQAMDKSVHAIHEDRLGIPGYQSLARTVTGQVNYMVRHCRLEPRADAQLHRIIARLLAGADAMAAKAPMAARRDGAVTVIGALADYGEFFDHPGWLPPAH
jgi:hypothetical protein